MDASSLRILWLKTGPLHPLDTGGKIRSFNMLRALRRTHDITYVSLLPAGIPDEVKTAAAGYAQHHRWIPWNETAKGSARFAAEVALNQAFSRRPYVIQKYRSPAMSAAIEELAGRGRHDLIVCDFLTPAVNLFGGSRPLRTPTLLFQHNVESLIWRRLGQTASGWMKRIYLRGQWRRMEKFERDTCARFHGVVGVSEADCDIMRTEFGASNVLGAVPTGVDCSFFGLPKGRRKPQSLVFPGSMDWLPNIDAAVFFVEAILPLVRRRFPEAVFTLVGRNPPAKLKRLATGWPGVRVTGTVDDVRPFLAEAAAMVVPLRVGGGTRIKIFEGMATGIPVISTRVGAEGLPVTHGENILLADTPQDFAGQIAAVFDEPERAARIGANGRAFVEAQFSWESAIRIFEGYCEQARAIGKPGA